ncbi:MAG: bifunctional pyr operon transcriptional regulator/uracil phosphoribosyltransferase PyrR [Opitutus sp.]
MAQPKTIGAEEMHAAIERLAAAIVERHPPPATVLLLGIANGGIELARRLTARIARLSPALSAKVGTLDISFHRDDFGRNPIPKEFAATHIPGDVNGADVVLVDDVLFSGRTIKAALDELFDHGRPTKVELAILTDRGGRRLPFAADYCGLVVAATEHQKVVVHLDLKDPSRDAIRIEASASRTSAL